MEHAEIEDLLPPTFLAKIVNRLFRGKEDDFSDVVKKGQPIIPQIERFADENDLELFDGWKVQLAELTKNQLFRTRDDQLLNEETDYINIWTELFTQLIS